MNLRNLIESRLDIHRLAKDLGEIGHWARVWAVRQWTEVDMATVWEAAKGFRPLALDDFVPPSIPSLVEVMHDGKSSISAFPRFQKRFCRPSGPTGDGTLVGYTPQSLSSLIGPGYFVAHPSTKTGQPGEVDIDYTLLPDQKPGPWPSIVGNDARLGRLVFSGTIDVMRGLSSHVTVGRAQRKGHWVDHWFVLVRQERQESPHPP